MIRATEADVPAIQDCLGRQQALSMFPQSNLARFGLDGTHAYAPSMWISREGDRVTDVLSVARNGTVTPFLPSGRFDEAAANLQGRAVTGVVGPAQWARPLLDAARLSGAAASLDRDEPQYLLSLDDLTVPDGPGALHPLAHGGLERMTDWYVAYDIEALEATPESARKNRGKAVQDYVAQDSHRVLMDGDEPLSVTGFNAALPSIVQVGGVYTPPAMRGHGLARRTVALHLAEARANGARAATLFSASAAATRVYEAIGFARIGAFTLCLFDKPEHVHG